MWEVTMVAAGASVQDLLWDSAGGGGPRGWCTWGFLHVHVTPPHTLVSACMLVAGPCSPARGVRILASIRCSARRVSAGRDPSPRPSLLCDSFFPVTARLPS